MQLPVVTTPPNRKRPGFSMPGLILLPSYAARTVQFTRDSLFTDPVEPPHVQKLFGFSTGIFRGGAVRAIPVLRNLEQAALWGWYNLPTGPHAVPYLRINGGIVTGIPFRALFAPHRYEIKRFGRREIIFYVDGLPHDHARLGWAGPVPFGWKLRDYLEPAQPKAVSYRAGEVTWN